VEAKILLSNVKPSEALILDRILGFLLPVSLIHVDASVVSKRLVETAYYLGMFFSREGGNYYLNLTVKRREEY